MTIEGDSEADFMLVLVVESRALPVSYVSSTLRVLQAAVREVARGVEHGGRLFESQPQPALLVDAETTAHGGLILKLYFADPNDDAPMPDLCNRAFSPFMEEFGRVLKGMPQRGLWGRMARRSGSARFRSEVARRLDDLRVELRHFRNATMRHRARSITFDGDQMEIE